jgi:hypothetical protein
MNHCISSVWTPRQRSRKTRPGWRKTWTLLGAALALLVLGVPDSSASASPWVIQPTPAYSSGSNPLTGVSCVSASDCVAVGGWGSPGAIGWNGTTWSQLPSVYGPLAGIACTSVSYCIAVGQAVFNRAGAWAWNGSTWTQLPAYNPGSTDNVLSSVACMSATRCEAVGSYGNGGTTYPLAEVWNGMIWKGQSTKGAPPGALDGVSCESRLRCEAVGENTYTLGGLAMGLRKSRWVSQPTPQGTNGDYQVQVYDSSVSCWSSGCTAVGGTTTAGHQGGVSYGSAAFADSWNGSKWTLQGGDGNPPNSDAATWSAVACHSATECVAVGEWLDPSYGAGTTTLISTWNGQAWTQQPSPDSPGSGDSWNALSCRNDGTACEAVGADLNDVSDLAMGNG